MPARALIRPGDTFGFWTVLAEAEPSVHPNSRPTRRLFCVCVCGKTESVRLCHLRRGATASCGCQAPKLISSKLTRHGHNGWKNRTTKEHRAWVNACRRNKVHPRDWESIGGDKRGFDRFLRDVGRAPSPNSQLIKKPGTDGTRPEHFRWL